jgi:hypothetical protein
MLQGAAGGDGTCIDSEGRLYVTAGDTGIHVFSVQRKHLSITTPHGNEYRTPGSVRNNAKAIYKIDMIAQGFMGHPK